MQLVVSVGVVGVVGWIGVLGLGSVYSVLTWFNHLISNYLETFCIIRYILIFIYKNYFKKEKDALRNLHLKRNLEILRYKDVLIESTCLVKSNAFF